MKKILRRAPRMLLLGGILSALLAVSVLAYLSASTDNSVTNTFTPAGETDPTIQETFKDNIKTNVAVSVGNPGYAVYVRAAIVVNWEKDDSENTFLATAPVAGTDYTISLNTETDDPWFLVSGDFYYHKAMVNSGGTTAALIDSCQLKEGVSAPDGYHLDVQIIAQTIQALGTTDDSDTPAVTNAWDIDITAPGGQLVPPTS